jgi:hypothetical protein
MHLLIRRFGVLFAGAALALALSPASEPQPDRW